VPFEYLDKLIPASVVNVSAALGPAMSVRDAHLVKVTRRDLPAPPSDRSLTSLAIAVMLRRLMADGQVGRASLLTQ
jgi:hypothetical protein